MHAKVFQITKQRVDKENTLDENTLTQGDGSYYDYCSEISDETRTEMIDYLVNVLLPKGMFSLIGIGEVTTENVLDWIGPTYQLEKELKNPLHTDHHFYLSEDSCQSYAEPSAELMGMVCSLPVGTHLYIGGVIDFHF